MSSSTFDRLAKSNSRASRTSSTQARSVSSFMSRASSYVTGTRRAQAASESQAASLDPNMGYTATPQQSRGGLRPFQGIFPAPDASVKIQRPAELPADKEEKYQKVLQHFKSIDEYPISFKSSRKRPLDDWEKLRLLSRESMQRYLRATKWDVAQAQKRLMDTIIWRREFGVDTLEPANLEPEAETGKETILGFDNKGRPLHYMHPNRNTTEETPRQMQFAVWVLEAAIDLMPPGVEQLALLINFGGKNRNPTSISNAKLMLYILQNHYVERLGIALCINVPWLFKAFWNAIYPFIDPVTKSKCKFDEAIKEEVPASQLAADFGGEVDFEYKHDKYWPDLVALVEQRRQQQLHRFRENCNREIGASEWVIRGGDEPDPRSALKKDSAFAESPELTAAAQAAQAAATMPAAEKVVSYRATREDGADEGLDDDADSVLDRFVTSKEELPENPLEEEAAAAAAASEAAAEAGTQSSSHTDSENNTVVNDNGEGRASTDSKKHGLGSLFHRNSRKGGKAHGDGKHDKSIFAAVVDRVHRNSSDEHGHKRGYASEATPKRSSLHDSQIRNAVPAN